MPHKDKEKEREHKRKYRQAHAEERRASDKKYREVHREKNREYQREYYQAHKEKGLKSQRNSDLRRKYGITVLDYDLLYSEQEGRCAICGGEKKLSVDHNHDTGTVRGLLCVGCNSHLSFVERGLHVAALDYLEKYL